MVTDHNPLAFVFRIWALPPNPIWSLEVLVALASIACPRFELAKTKCSQRGADSPVQINGLSVVDLVAYGVSFPTSNKRVDLTGN